MDLNRIIPKAGSAIVTVTVFLFALFLLIDYSMGSYFVCLILPIGFIMMTAGLHNECKSLHPIQLPYNFRQYRHRLQAGHSPRTFLRLLQKPNVKM